MWSRRLKKIWTQLLLTFNFKCDISKQRKTRVHIIMETKVPPTNFMQETLLSHDVLPHATPRHTTPHHTVPYYTILHHITLCHTTPHNFTPQPISEPYTTAQHRTELISTAQQSTVLYLLYINRRNEKTW